ncbi:hypothetical protein [Metapseudomonas furukawaii]|uniref:Lipoprotein n=1 Tax=Metapseudomonas furukawaii TaxID=1149133 RepID=A0AAD1FI38_METFU|nr:hypothetical protein [Pseudomonas furukawaii]ELS26300.1 hypothetical protein ppKF707_5926 [Pseudomonas furukawaii]BAU77410.1 hypothetical protein KF707C_p210 [Pseudomonas furukawaii]
MKRYWILAMAVLVLGGVTGCKDDQDSAPQPPAPVKERKTDDAAKF